jgi:hypothetical protein
MFNSSSGLNSQDSLKWLDQESLTGGEGSVLLISLQELVWINSFYI